MRDPDFCCSAGSGCCAESAIGRSRYSPSDGKTWETLNRALQPLHELYATRHYQLFAPVVLGKERLTVPTQNQLSTRLQEAVGWSIAKANGLVEPGLFLETIAGRVFPATDYVRDPSCPLFTPDPDWLHEAIGHIGSLVVPKVAGFYEHFGRIAVKHASDPERVERINRLYWFANEVGLVREGDRVKVFGGAILSSVHEMVTFASAALQPFDPEVVAATPVDVTKPQPILFVAESIDQMIGSTLDYLKALD